MINKEPIEPQNAKAHKEYRKHIQTCPSSLEQMNAKARMRGMSYGKYVSDVSLGRFKKDRYKLVPLK